MVGRTLSHYRISARIGEGGMGEVYRAQDTKLGREVALKVLPPGYVTNPARLARFQREARLAAALNHPGIVTVHSVEESDGVHFLTMELVSGKPLSDLIPPRGFPLPALLDLGHQLADAVAAAHHAGVTHRDLKPANVMVDAHGRVKVLDFGLARPSNPSDDPDNLSTLGSVTGEGRIVGTVAYMSPEQAQGRTVDHRSDVFSLGVILHEMATGQRPFQGDSNVDVLSSILRDDPPSITEHVPALPYHLGRVVKHCLAKDPGHRYQSALDVRNELVGLADEVSSGEIPAEARRQPRRRGRGLVYAAAIAVIALGVVGLWLVWDRVAPDPAPGPFRVVSTRRLTEALGLEMYPSLSRDGQTLIYASDGDGDWDIYRRRVRGATSFNLTAGHSGIDTQPALSPDGDWIVFRSERDGGGLFLMGATGESVRRLTDLGHNPSWSPDGSEVVFATEEIVDPDGRHTMVSELWIVSVADGEPRKLSDGDAVQPSWSPHGDRIAYWARLRGSSWRDVWTIAAGGGEPVRVTEDAPTDWSPAWSSDGAYLYFSSDRSGSMGLWRVPIEESSGRVRGDPEPLTMGSGEEQAHLSVSGDGRLLAYSVRRYGSNIEKVDFDPSRGEVAGGRVALTDSSGYLVNPKASPDGLWVAYASGPREDIHVIRTDGTGHRQLTDDSHKDRMPGWSADSRRILFYSDRGGAWDLWTVNADGSGLAPLAHGIDSGVTQGLWSPNDQRVACTLGGEAFVLDLPEGSRPGRSTRLPPIPGEGIFVPWDWSPDGTRIAGMRLRPDGARSGVFVFDLAAQEYEEWAATGDRPVWLRDGRQLLYVDDYKLFLRDMSSGSLQEVSWPSPPMPIGTFGLSPDDRTLYFSIHQIEADIWLLEME